MPDHRPSLDTLLSSGTVLGDWFGPMVRALDKVRFHDAPFSALPMAAFVLSGGLRHLLGAHSLREYIQALFHLDAQCGLAPVARSTWADALASGRRRDVLRQGLEQLVALARDALPDRLADLPGLGKRPVIATDATYQNESAHYRPHYSSQGGPDNAKGHMLLSCYDLRHGIPLWVSTQTQSLGEMRALKGVQTDEANPLRMRGAIHVVDRAFIDGRFWDQRLRLHQSTVITRMKSSLNHVVIQSLEVPCTPTNEGVLYDFEITLACSQGRWRLVGFTSPEGTLYEYLTNDLTLPAGVVAFLYHRRWDKEKYYDCFKNDLAGAKAWGKSPVAIEQQALLGVMTVILTRLFMHRRQTDLGLAVPDATQSTKQAKKRARHESSDIGVTLRALWTHLSKLTRQLWRFLKNCFAQKHDPALYKRRLEPLLLRYL